jgi:peptide/nickel transport system substrate-binding protein
MTNTTRRDVLTLLAGAALPIAVRHPARAAGRSLRLALSSSLVRLDPLLTTFGDEYVYNNLVFNGLTRLDEDQAIQPDLAEKWSFSPDLTSWTFTLRQGVKFHDGSPMTAADVVAVFRRMADPATVAPSASNFDMVAAVEAPDELTVTFKLSFPYGAFAELLSDRQVKIVPRSRVAQLATQPIGTGPFRFVSYSAGDRMVLARNPDYFEPGLPKLDGIELLIIPEMSAKIAGLRSGEIDIVWDLPLDQVKTLSGDKSLRVESVASGAWDAVVMNNDTKPFNDPRVRKAFNLGVSKDDVVDLVLFGQGVPTISPIPPTHPFYAHDIPTAPADPDAARKLLAEAGYPNGIKIPIIVPVERPVRERLGVALQQLLQPAGFDLQVQRVSYSSYSAQVSGKAPLYVEGFFGRATIDASTYPFLHSDGIWDKRLWHYKNAAVDAALAAARLSGDPAVQRTQYVAMQHALNDDPACFFAYSTNFACAYRASVKGVRTHPGRWFDLRSATLG